MDFLVAIQEGNIQPVKTLLEGGRDPNAKVVGFANALQAAAWWGCNYSSPEYLEIIFKGALFYDLRSWSGSNWAMEANLLYIRLVRQLQRVLSSQYIVIRDWVAGNNV
jgi:hypothetical protein